MNSQSNSQHNNVSSSSETQRSVSRTEHKRLDTKIAKRRNFLLDVTPLAGVTFVMALSLIFFSCKKNQLGGTSTIKGKVAHHSKPIPFARVFIKFKAKDFPGSDTTKYDDHVTADAGGNYEIKCYKGDYYLYGYGSDVAISPPLVTGGLHVHIRKGETSNTEVAVTED
jgi:hypothetical protein